MDLADIKRRAQEAREFTVALDGIGYTLRLPTQYEVEIEAVRARLHNGEHDPAQLTVLRRRLLERAVVAWPGVTCERLAPGAGSAQADATPEAVALLLDAEPQLAQRLDAAFVDRMVARNARQDEAAKN
jgi:hypothetical protein